MDKPKPPNKTNQTVLSYLALTFALILLIVGGLAFWANRFTTNIVKSELTAQKIYFPEKGSTQLDPRAYPNLQKYAGQLVDTPEEAKAYANEYIGSHLKKVAGGKVYAEVSTDAQKDPNNKKLQEQKQTLFQGETLRGMLLSSGYGFGTIGKIAGFAAYIAFAASVVLFVLFLILRRK